MWVQEYTTKGETLTAETAVKGIQNVNHDDSIAGTFNGIAGLSWEVYSYLVAATTDEALGVVKAVESGDGIEAWAELHKRYNKRTMTRMMRVLMECMYPKEVEGGGIGGGNIAMGRKVEEDDGRTAERNKYPRAVADGGVDEDMSKSN